MAEPLKPKSFGKDLTGSVIKKDSNKNSPALRPKKSKQNNSGIPKKVANRMARRIAVTTGIPTLAGMGVFIFSYIVISKGIADIPPGITLLSSAGCFLIGLIGLSYGILSASWDNANGTLLGLENIKPNISRMRDAFKTTN